MHAKGRKRRRREVAILGAAALALALTAGAVGSANAISQVSRAAQPQLAAPSAKGATSKLPCGGQRPLKSTGVAWKCTWSDEFNGTSLSKTWSVIPYGLGSSCRYNNSNYVTEKTGSLHLLAKLLPANDPCRQKWNLKYGGGGIQTAGKFNQMYGRFEIRAKLPAGAGYWPAFWLVSDDNAYSGEIDVLEAYGGRGNTGDATLHNPAGGPGINQKTCAISPDYSSSYHTYTLEWKFGELKIFYDGRICADFKSSADGSPLPKSFSGKPYYVLLDLAVDPWYPPNANTPAVGSMDVDYVRAWK